MTASLIGWMASNYNLADPFLMISSVVLVVIFVYAMITVNLKAFDKMNELEDL